MVQARLPLDPVADLAARLRRERVGTALPGIRRVARVWWRDHGFAETPAVVGKRVAVALIEQRETAVQLAGILVLAGLELRATDLPVFARLFASGQLAELAVVDAFASRVLAVLLARAQGRREVTRTLAAWRLAESMWQRRAACLAFVRLAPEADPALVSQLLAIAATVVWSHEHTDQTAVGALLRELARASPARVEAFFRRTALLMSRACARRIVAGFAPERRAELLAHHRRATSLP